MDGVLADTEPLHEKSRDVLLAKLGLDVAALSPRAYAKSKRLYWGEVAKECQLSLTAEELTQEEFVILMDIAEHSGLKANPGVEKRRFVPCAVKGFLQQWRLLPIVFMWKKF